VLLTEKGIRTKAARAMAWNFQNLEIGTEKISVWRFFDQKIRLHRFDFELETKAARKFAIGNHRRRRVCLSRPRRDREVDG
jgi:hypothetical protein